MTGPGQVDDAALDRIEPSWVVDADDDCLRGRVTWPAGIDPAAALVASVVDVHDLSDLFALAEALVEGSARSWDGGGIAITGEAVVVHDALDRRARTSMRALAGLLARSIAQAEAADPGRLSDADRRIARSVNDLARPSE